MRHSDNTTTVMMFVVFFLTFLVLWNVTDLVSKIENQEQGSHTYQNIKAINVQFEKLEELKESGEQKEAKEYILNQLKNIFDKIEQTKKCNISISSLYFPVKFKQNNVLVEIVLKENEILPYKIGESCDDTGALLIGESLTKYMLEKNEKQFLCLYNEYYSINAVLENFGISKQDERVIVLYQNLSVYEKQKLYERLGDYFFQNYTDGITISLGSDDDVNLMNTYRNFEDFLGAMENVEERVVLAKEQSGERNYWYKLYHSIVGGISIVFALLNVFVVSNLWFCRRRKEFLLRLIFGYSPKRIWLMIWNELGKISICSLCCSSILWIVFLLAKEKAIQINLIAGQCVVMLIGTLLVLLITTIYMFAKIIMIDPAQGLNKYRG